MNSRVNLEGRSVGLRCPVFIVAEIGVNHNGDLGTARQLIDAAASCGVDAVKFQTFRTEEFLADRTVTYEYESAGKTVSEPMFAMFRRLELPPQWHGELFDHARRRGLVPLTSVADPASADLVRTLGICALKLSSEDLINLPLIEYAAASGLPLLLSTGMADDTEIEDVLSILAAHGQADVVFLHCVSMYPTPEEDANLLRIGALRTKVEGPVGYSDHTLGIDAAVAAVAMGACLIEKHFTLSRRMPGPDHAISCEPQDLLRLVQRVRSTESLLGTGQIPPGPREAEMRLLFRRSVVAAHDLPSGHLLVRQDITCKRPGTGLHPRQIPALCGRRLRRDIPRDSQIHLSDLM